MSRNLKRVALTFDWPLKKVWGGYLNPYYELAAECPDCDNGYDRAGGRTDANAALFSAQWYGNAPFDPFVYGAESPSLTQEHPAFHLAKRNVDNAPAFYMSRVEQKERGELRQGAMEGFKHDEPLVPFPSYDKAGAIDREAKRLHAMWRGQWCHHLIQVDVDALIAADRLWDFTRRPMNAEQAQKLHDQEARGGSGFWLEDSNGHHPTAAEVNAWSFGGFGHDGLNQGACVEARCAREGVPWRCVRCNGSGKIWPTPEIKQQCDAWKETEPPTGEGYQLWEDCSEGSPVSPVFSTLDDLCAWAEINATTFASFTATADEWKEMLDGGIVHHKEGSNVFL